MEDTQGAEILICSLTWLKANKLTDLNPLNFSIERYWITSKISITMSILDVTSEFWKNVWYQILKRKCMKPHGRQLNDHFATREPFFLIGNG